MKISSCCTLLNTPFSHPPSSSLPTSKFNKNNTQRPTFHTNPTTMPTALTETPLQKRKLYCLTICSYRKAGTTEEEYADYMSNHHSQPCKAFMAKYKVLRWHVVSISLFPITHSSHYPPHPCPCSNSRFNKLAASFPPTPPLPPH